jgi:hypothetical protein
MKIQAGSSAGAAAVSARPQSTSVTAFEPAATGVREAAPSGPAGAVSIAPSLDALLALQEMPGPLERRRRAVKRGGRLLDLLDSVKLSLLDGAGASTVLGDLKDAVQEHRGETGDSGLEQVLDEIETRAAVELAKAEVARRGAAPAMAPH